MTCRSLIDFLVPPLFFFQPSIFELPWHRLMSQLLIWTCKRCLIYVKQLRNMRISRCNVEPGDNAEIFSEFPLFIHSIQPWITLLLPLQLSSHWLTWNCRIDSMYSQQLRNLMWLKVLFADDERINRSFARKYSQLTSNVYQQSKKKNWSHI